MDKIFASQVGRIMQIYVDDMIFKSFDAQDHIDDLVEMFERIKTDQVCLNPTKCSSGLSGGKFLGFILTNSGIEADPDQIKAIQDLPISRTLKDLQVLTGCIATLRRFIPQSSKWCLPLYNAIKSASRSSTFEWTRSCEETYETLRNSSLHHQ